MKLVRSCLLKPLAPRLLRILLLKIGRLAGQVSQRRLYMRAGGLDQLGYGHVLSIEHQQLQHGKKLVPSTSDYLLHAQHRGISTNSAFISDNFFCYPNISVIWALNYVVMISGILLYIKLVYILTLIKFACACKRIRE